MTIVVPGGAAGAASSATLESLNASVAKWLNRTDLDLVLVDFVRLAEAEFARDTRLRSSFQVLTESGYTASGEVVLPSDLLELKALALAGRDLIAQARTLAGLAMLAGSRSTRSSTPMCERVRSARAEPMATDQMNM